MPHGISLRDGQSLMEAQSPGRLNLKPHKVEGGRPSPEASRNANKLKPPGRPKPFGFALKSL